MKSKNIVLVAILILLPCAGSRMMATSSPFDWSRNAEGQPYVSSPSAFKQNETLNRTYSPTIYEVGTNSLPSDAYNPTGEGPSRPGGNIRKDFDTPDDPNKSEDYPVGEPWILLLLAAAFAAFVARRKVKGKAL